MSSTIACGNGATVGTPPGILAVGAYSPIGYGDNCGGSGKLPSLCIPHDLVEVVELTSSNSAVAAIVAGQDHPRAPEAKAAYYVLGTGEGEATLTFKGRFDDGSVRQATTTMHVKTPDSLKLVAVCYNGTSSSDLLTTVATQESFSLEIRGGTDGLMGWLPSGVTADGVIQQFDEYNNPYVWQSPSTPIVEQLQSTVAANVTGTLTAFALDQVADIDLLSGTVYPNAFVEPGAFDVQATAVINGRSPCQPQPVELHISTPAVCSGPAGETVWVGIRGSIETAAHAEGTCTIGAAMPGFPVVATASFPIFFVSAPPPGLFSLSNDPCPVEGHSACQYGNGRVGICQAKHWVEQPPCATNEVCDLVPDTAPGCVAGTTCAKCRGLH